MSTTPFSADQSFVCSSAHTQQICFTFLPWTKALQGTVAREENQIDYNTYPQNVHLSLSNWHVLLIPRAPNFWTSCFYFSIPLLQVRVKVLQLQRRLVLGWSGAASWPSISRGHQWAWGAVKEHSGAQSDLCSDLCVPGAPQLCRESSLRFQVKA